MRDATQAQHLAISNFVRGQQRRARHLEASLRTLGDTDPPPLQPHRASIRYPSERFFPVEPPVDLVLEQPTRPARQSSPAGPAAAEPIADAPTVRAPYPSARASQDRAQFWVQVTLYGLVTLLILFAIALPLPGPRRADALAERRYVELSLALAEIRAVLADFRADHGIYPGQGRDGHGDPALLSDQIARPTHSNGTVVVDNEMGGRLERVRGPYRDGGVPANPINGLASVRFLRADEAWPAEGDGRTGWLYRPSTGEIRANLPGRALPAARRYLDL